MDFNVIFQSSSSGEVIFDSTNGASKNIITTGAQTIGGEVSIGQNFFTIDDFEISISENHNRIIFKVTPLI